MLDAPFAAGLDDEGRFRAGAPRYRLSRRA
ncbi:MAG: hypothetical protein QOF69_3516, partial [Solirubrobacteraceae bacterium]|nr:hypothetical protein [Solirubrobacteraceae bacterium]